MEALNIYLAYPHGRPRTELFLLVCKKVSIRYINLHVDPPMIMATSIVEHGELVFENKRASFNDMVNGK